MAQMVDFAVTPTALHRRASALLLPFLLIFAPYEGHPTALIRTSPPFGNLTGRISIVHLGKQA